MTSDPKDPFYAGQWRTHASKAMQQAEVSNDAGVIATTEALVALASAFDEGCSRMMGAISGVASSVSSSGMQTSHLQSISQSLQAITQVLGMKGQQFDTGSILGQVARTANAMETQER